MGDLVKTGAKSAIDNIKREKEENLMKEKHNKEMIQKKYETGKKYEQELLEKLKKAPKAKTNRKDWGSNNADVLMEERLKKINEDKKSKDQFKDSNKKGVKENFTNLPQDKFNQVKELGKIKSSNKFNQTQNLDNLLNKKDKKLKDDQNQKPPKPKRDMETHLIKKAEIKEQFKQ